MKIFISYSHKDKIFVNDIVQGISKQLGSESILFDEWNVKPGDSIIGFMNDSLSEFTHFVFFLSPDSVNSYMASLEWKNALSLCSNKSRSFIPIIVGQPNIPPILSDLKYIDSNLNGIDGTINQILCAISKESDSHIPPKLDNLTYRLLHKSNMEVEIMIETKFYSEPNASFCFAFLNDGKIRVKDFEPFNGSNEIRNLDGKECWLQFARLFRPVSPGMPVYFSFISDRNISLFVLMHVVDEDGNLKGIPIKQE